MGPLKCSYSSEYLYIAALHVFIVLSPLSYISIPSSRGFLHTVSALVRFDSTRHRHRLDFFPPLFPCK